MVGRREAGLLVAQHEQHAEDDQRQAHPDGDDTGSHASARGAGAPVAAEGEHTVRLVPGTRIDVEPEGPDPYVEGMVKRAVVNGRRELVASGQQAEPVDAEVDVTGALDPVGQSVGVAVLEPASIMPSRPMVTPKTGRSTAAEARYRNLIVTGSPLRTRETGAPPASSSSTVSTLISPEPQRVSPSALGAVSTWPT